ncbi:MULTISPECIES: SMI1/KNR4 family protein [unclassified Actinotalea]|uniref:SMI1/KNR4 family protein n=1 Tax=unclassified Actinotalea TaxID=2638618 RepID=UPI0015F3F872|nr:MULTISPECIES: SMI1/KNR4 family protein [unclassified Actinotalea]
MSTMNDAAGATAAPNWRALLGEIGLTRMRLDEAAPQVYPLTIPHKGATSDQLAGAEGRLRHALDPIHRELLTYANGWSAMFVDTDLLSTEQLGADGLWEQTRDLLKDLEEDWPPGYLPPVDQLEIIGASTVTSDLFLLWTAGPVTGGGRPVLWLGAGQIVQQWANVADFMWSVLAYTRKTLDDVLAKRPPFDRL